MPDTIVSDSQRNSASKMLQETWIARYPWMDALKRNNRITTRAGDRLELKYVVDDSEGYSFGPESEVEATQKGEVISQVFDWGAHARDDKQLGWDMENQGAVDKLTTGTLRDIYATRVDMGNSKFFESVNLRLWRGAGLPYNSQDAEALDFLGVEQFVPDDPTIGTIGELSRVTNAFIRSKTLAGSAGESGVWDNDCWELLLRLNVACSESPRTWGENTAPDFWFSNQAALTDIVKLAYAQNTNIGAEVQNINSVGGVFTILNSAIQGNRVYALRSDTWRYYKPPGVRSMVELDIRSQLEKRMNLKDTIFIWKARGCQVCEWCPQNGLITDAA